MYVWLYIYLDISFVVFIKVYILYIIPQQYHNKYNMHVYFPLCIFTQIFHFILVVLFQCYSRKLNITLPKVVYEEHTTNQDL